MNTRENMVIDMEEMRFITSDVAWINYENGRYNVRFANGKSYLYSIQRICWLRPSGRINVSDYSVYDSEKRLDDIKEIYLFRDKSESYYHVFFKNGTQKSYMGFQLRFEKNCLSEKRCRNVFSYLKEISSLVNIKTEEGTSLLSLQYDSLEDNFYNDSVLGAYLNPERQLKKNSINPHPPIFPFGCNGSQYTAVKEALENKLSVIQGPPGTGKTQTILNIVANLIIKGKNVLIVSNNNSATANIAEKLSSSKYGMGFLLAALGRSENKEKFISSQKEEYPDISSWRHDFSDNREFFARMDYLMDELKFVFAAQEQIAVSESELQNINLEYEHFKRYVAETTEVSNIQLRKKQNAKRLMSLWQELQHMAEKKNQPSFWFKIKSRVFYGIADKNLYKRGMSEITTAFQWLYYKARIGELEETISKTKETLRSKNATELSKEFGDLSMTYFKSYLFERYGKNGKRRVFKNEELQKEHKAVQKEYPIVLSTSFSARLSLGKDATFDYVIMDEASQVDVATGALALSVARNAVIVGDSKQLPNVVTAETRDKAENIFKKYNLNDNYQFSERSFLTSICGLFPNIPQTLLREHYRCHPKIINFCNQKFYGGNLVIMTQDDGENDVLSVTKTVKGQHRRGNTNQRQMDSLKEEVIPRITTSLDEVGIITPYNAQVEIITAELKGVDVATVHKFQGREKDVIILTTVDDEVTEFTDDPYLLNVAISRAKKQLHLIVSGNEQPADSNIADLISYIEYNNFSVSESKLYSVFDYLYKDYTAARMEFLKNHNKISEYDSENLMYALIKNTFSEQGFVDLDVVCHQPLNMLIRDPSLLDEKETKYAMNTATHLDFLIYNKVSKKALLAIEVDGVSFHSKGSEQEERDKMKNRILDLYKIPYLRFATNGSQEKEKLLQKLKEIRA